MRAKKIRTPLRSLSQKCLTALAAPTQKHAQIILTVFGFSILALGIAEHSSAASQAPGAYNDVRIAEFANRVFAYIEGSMGALIMVAAGLGAIISAAFGQYRASLALLVVAVGAFILRSLVSTFFNDDNIA